MSDLIPSVNLALYGIQFFSGVLSIMDKTLKNLSLTIMEDKVRREFENL